MSAEGTAVTVALALMDMVPGGVAAAWLLLQAGLVAIWRRQVAETVHRIETAGLDIRLFTAVIARIEDKLNNGDLKGAALEWNGVPDTAKPAGEAFKAKLDQRLRVEAAIDAAVAATMAKPGTEG